MLWGNESWNITCRNRCEENKIIVIADENGLSWESLVLLGQQSEIYQAKNIQDAFSQFDRILLSFGFNCSKTGTGNSMPDCRSNPKDGDNSCA